MESNFNKSNNAKSNLNNSSSNKIKGVIENNEKKEGIHKSLRNDKGEYS